MRRSICAGFLLFSLLFACTIAAAQEVTTPGWTQSGGESTQANAAAADKPEWWTSEDITSEEIVAMAREYWTLAEDSSPERQKEARKRIRKLHGTQSYIAIEELLRIARYSRNDEHVQLVVGFLSRIGPLSEYAIPVFYEVMATGETEETRRRAKRSLWRAWGGEVAILDTIGKMVDFDPSRRPYDITDDMLTAAQDVAVHYYLYDPGSKEMIHETARRIRRSMGWKGDEFPASPFDVFGVGPAQPREPRAEPEWTSPVEEDGHTVRRPPARKDADTKPATPQAE